MDPLPGQKEQRWSIAISENVQLQVVNLPPPVTCAAVHDRAKKEGTFTVFMTQQEHSTFPIPDKTCTHPFLLLCNDGYTIDDGFFVYSFSGNAWGSWYWIKAVAGEAIIQMGALLNDMQMLDVDWQLRPIYSDCRLKHYIEEMRPHVTRMENIRDKITDCRGDVEKDTSRARFVFPLREMEISLNKLYVDLVGPPQASVSTIKDCGAKSKKPKHCWRKQKLHVSRGARSVRRMTQVKQFHER